MRHGVLTFNPWLGLGDLKPHEARVFPPMLIHHYQFIVANVAPEFRLFVRVLGEEGLRPGEGARLTPDKLVGTTLYVKKSKTRSGEREVYIRPQLAAEIKGVLPFTSPDGMLLSTRAGYNRFRWAWDQVVVGMLCQEAGCKPGIRYVDGRCPSGHPLVSFVPYDLRRGHISWLRDAKVQAEVVRDRAGHSHTSMTSVYARAQGDGGAPEVLENLFGAA